MVETIVSYLTHKGVVMGATAGVLKVLYSIRARTFNGWVALTDFAGAIIVGHETYNVLDALHLAIWQINLLTLVAAINTFLLIGIFMNPKLIEALLSRYLGTLPTDPTKDTLPPKK